MTRTIAPETVVVIDMNYVHLPDRIPWTVSTFRAGQFKSDTLCGAGQETRLMGRLAKITDLIEKLNVVELSACERCFVGAATE